MTVTEAMDEIKKEMESLFGKGLVGIIMINARSKAKAPVIGMTKEHFDSIVEQICGDDRVVGMLGAAGSRQKLGKWKKLVD